MRQLMAVMILLSAVSFLGLRPAHAGLVDIYWGDFSNLKVQRADFNCSNLKGPATSVGPSEITVDNAGEKIYWAEFRNNKIVRADLDGMNQTDLVTCVTNPFDVAFDVLADKMYWIDYGTDKIQRANLDGSGIEDLVSTGLTTPNGIALDIAAKRMCWAEQTNGKIQFANLGGTGVTDLITGLSNPYWIALDLVNDQVYLTTGNVGDSIQRTNLDGSGAGNLVIGLNFLMGIALIIPSATVPEPSSAFLTIFGLLGGCDEPTIRRDAVSRLALIYSL